MAGFDLAQTFYLDKDAVEGADSIFVTSVDLYFFGKPVSGKTKSGITNPGASVYLAMTNDNGSPNLDLYHHTFAGRVEYENILTDASGATATTFTFRQPVPLSTARSYAFLIKFDGSDPDFKLWYNKAGENVFGTTTKTQVTSGKVDGAFYTITNGRDLTPVLDADLSFNLQVAKFSKTSETFRVYNRKYEILRVNSMVGDFKGGEDVYRLSANATGTVAISENSTTLTGTGTSFNTTLLVGDKFAITDGTPGNTEIRTVVSVTNATSMVVDVVPSFSNTSGNYFKTVTAKLFDANGLSDHVILQDSTANTTVYLSAGERIYGVDSQATALITTVLDYAVNGLVPNFDIKTPAGTAVTASLNFANAAYQFSDTNAVTATLGDRLLINQYDPVIFSQSNKVTTAATEDAFRGLITFTTTNPYVSPYVREENMDLFVERYELNNTTTNEYTGFGSAKTRYISKVIPLSDDQIAEDLKIYVRAYRPANTNIIVYARLRNSEDLESMDLKDWTELSLVTANTDYSNPTNIYDRKELEYSIPFYRLGTTATGSFTTLSACTVVTGTSGSVSTEIANGNLVRVYSPIIPSTYFVDTVVESNTTTFTLATGTGANASLVGTGLKVDVIDRPSSAFLDIQSQNIVTYYNKARAIHKGFDSFALKIVLLSEDGIKVPYVDDVRAIAVSA
jgi:hypothetical protein